MSVTAYIALGSNLGDRAANLDRAIEKLRGQLGVTVNQVSTVYETEPVGGPPGQPDFLNAVVEVQTQLAPRALLELLLRIEGELGRVRGEPNGPRTIDLDLLLYGDEVIGEEGLQVPHPRLHLRSFVLEPLAEIAPALVHPRLGVTIQKLWDDYDPDATAGAGERQGGLLSAAVPAVRPLQGQRAVVTGSTGGIGRAIALAFARAGADVVIHGRREDAATEVVHEVRALGVSSDFILADLGENDECRGLVEVVFENWDEIDVWVNNAGADTLTGEAAKWPFLRKLNALLDIDVVATMLLARDVGRRMRKQGHGVILNMGWDQAETGMEGDSGELFAATKGAVMAFTRSVALSLAPEVRVNCLAPGWIQTAWGGQASEYWQERVQEETPLRRWGTPDDVAAAAVWLASPAAAFITGQIVRVNGGAVR